MLYKVIIFSLGLLALANCNAQKDPKASVTPIVENTQEIKTKNKGENIIYFNEGENKFLKEYEMNLTFKGISEDSRCPEGVNCIWAGVAIAQVEVMGPATRPMIINLATTDDMGRNYHQSVDFNGYTISLKSAISYPTTQEGSRKYKIGIVINKTKANPTTK